MGIGINGYIEIRHTFKLQLKGEARWYGVVNLDQLLGPRDYFMFHSLFGIRDDTDFEPIAPDRGLPKDASDAVLKALEELNEDPGGEDLYGFGHTWVTFAELQAVDWEETALTGLALEYEDDERPDAAGYIRRNCPNADKEPSLKKRVTYGSFYASRGVKAWAKTALFYMT